MAASRNPRLIFCLLNAVISEKYARSWRCPSARGGPRGVLETRQTVCDFINTCSWKQWFLQCAPRGMLETGQTVCRFTHTCSRKCLFLQDRPRGMLETRQPVCKFTYKRSLKCCTVCDFEKDGSDMCCTFRNSTRTS